VRRVAGLLSLLALLVAPATVQGQALVGMYPTGVGLDAESATSGVTPSGPVSNGGAPSAQPGQSTSLYSPTPDSALHAPTVATSMPKNRLMNALASDPPPSATTLVKPNSTIEKYSGESNDSAIFAMSFLPMPFSRGFASY